MESTWEKKGSRMDMCGAVNGQALIGSCAPTVKLGDRSRSSHQCEPVNSEGSETG